MAKRPPEDTLSFRQRRAGLLLHLTSLPGPHGSGDLGRAAHRFVDFVADAGHRWWQMLPVGPLGPAPGFSPYSSNSSRAGNGYLVALEPLVEQGLLSKRDLRPERALPQDAVDYKKTNAFRESRLRRAFEAFERERGEREPAYRKFRRANDAWLDDFALFAAMKNHEPRQAWWDWDAPLRDREPGALAAAHERLARDVAYERFVQFEFDRQWRALREHAEARGVGLIGDVPIFVSGDSVDVWGNRGLFQLDKRGRAQRVTGVPPDLFSSEGQKWGHPQYDWPAHEREHFAWWTARFGAMFERFHAVRIDHFLGFARVWSIPADKPSKKGRWVQSPGEALFGRVLGELGDRPIIAEDLGELTPQAAALRDRFGFPGMRVIQFGLGFGGGDEYHLPHAYVPGSVAYTGTHDNDTTRGWYDKLKRSDRRKTDAFAGTGAEGIAWAMIRAVYASASGTVIIPAQDALSLGGEARMNMPGTNTGNWRWRVREGELSAKLARRLRELAEATRRA